MARRAAVGLVATLALACAGCPDVDSIREEGRREGREAAERECAARTEAARAEGIEEGKAMIDVFAQVPPDTGTTLGVTRPMGLQDHHFLHAGGRHAYYEMVTKRLADAAAAFSNNSPNNGGPPGNWDAHHDSATPTDRIFKVRTLGNAVAVDEPVVHDATCAGTTVTLTTPAVNTVQVDLQDAGACAWVAYELDRFHVDDLKAANPGARISLKKVGNQDKLTLTLHLATVGSFHECNYTGAEPKCTISCTQ